VATLKIAKDRRLPFNQRTVDQAKALAKKLEPHHARTLWAFCLTGMRPEEIFEEIGNTWTMEADGVRIRGTKSPAADRVVPRVGLPVKPATKRLAFYRALRTASGETVTPYDLRRTYAQWLDLARIPQFRQDYYMADGPKDLNALYKRCGKSAPTCRRIAPRSRR
jgi:integrase